MTVLASRVAETAQPPAVQLVFSDDTAEPMVRLGFATLDIARASERVERLGGGGGGTNPSGGGRLGERGHTPVRPRHPGPAARGVLGVIFVFARDPRRAAGFYQRFAGGYPRSGQPPDGHSGTVTC